MYQSEINWPLHWILALLTGGLWLIPMLVMALNQSTNANKEGLERVFAANRAREAAVRASEAAARAERTARIHNAASETNALTDPTIRGW